MEIYLPAGAIILPIQRKRKIHYFFFDTGFPFSFSSEISQINGEDIDISNKFSLNLQPTPVNINSLCEHLGVDLAGFLGLDFLHKFQNAVVNFKKKIINFNVGNFKGEISLKMKETNPLLTTISLETQNNYQGTCLIDTGAYQSMFFNSEILQERYKRSNGWRFPSAQGDMSIDYFSGIETFTPDNRFGKFIFGYPTNLPPAPFQYVLGLNILSQYECCFNMKEKELQFKSEPRDRIYGADFSEDLYFIGFQFIIRNHKLYVSNILDNCPNPTIRVGDELRLDNVDFENPEVINQVYEKISSIGKEKEVKMVVNNKVMILRTSKMFI